MRSVLILFVFGLFGCTTPKAVQYAQLKHPDCRVVYVGTEGFYDVVRVHCPNSKPRLEKYRQH